MNRHSKLVALLFVIGLVVSSALAQGEDLGADYKVCPQDTLVIAVVGEKDLTQDCRVNTSGTISFAWLSNVEVAGKTAAEVEQYLRKLLDKDYLVDPTVLVQVKEYRAREVTVMGQVNKPGAVAIPAEQPLTIVEAIARAGSIAKGGDPNKIWFTRRGREKVKLSLDQLSRVTDPSKQLYVQPGDVIDVGEKVF
ncbi:MAG TPA: polysaccharide biosynthesis/export family protein [Verrucomicrobiae bacterium]